MQFEFRQACLEDQSMLIEWHESPHVMLFWDNSEQQRQQMHDFLIGAYSRYTFWIGSLNSIPFSLIMSSSLTPSNCPEYILPYLSNHQDAMSLDFMIGNEHYLGRRLAAPTLKAFMTHIKNHIQPNIGSFIIDPAEANLKAIRAYLRAGFHQVGSFTPNSGSFKGISHLLMLKNFA